MSEIFKQSQCSLSNDIICYVTVSKNNVSQNKLTLETYITPQKWISHANNTEGIMKLLVQTNAIAFKCIESKSVAIAILEGIVKEDKHKLLVQTNVNVLWQSAVLLSKLNCQQTFMLTLPSTSFHALTLKPFERKLTSNIAWSVKLQYTWPS